MRAASPSTRVYIGSPQNAPRSPTPIAPHIASWACILSTFHIYHTKNNQNKSISFSINEKWVRKRLKRAGPWNIFFPSDVVKCYYIFYWVMFWATWTMYGSFWVVWVDRVVAAEKGLSIYMKGERILCTFVTNHE